jgi:hypothetical protein
LLQSLHRQRSTTARERRDAAPDAFATELKRGVASLNEDLRTAIFRDLLFLEVCKKQRYCRYPATSRMNKGILGSGFEGALINPGGEFPKISRYAATKICAIHG